MWNLGQELGFIISFDLRISRSPAISFPTLTVASVARVTVALFVVMLTTRVSPGTAGLSSKRGPLATKPRFAVTSPRPRLASALTGATDEHLSRTRATSVQAIKKTLASIYRPIAAPRPYRRVGS